MHLENLVLIILIILTQMGPSAKVLQISKHEESRPGPSDGKSPPATREIAVQVFRMAPWWQLSARVGFSVEKTPNVDVLIPKYGFIGVYPTIIQLSYHGFFGIR